MNVSELLDKKNIQFTQKGNDYIIKCLNPEHPDTNPSMRVDRTVGIFNCFSCGFKGNLFYYFDEKVNWLQTKKEVLKQKIEKKLIESIGLTIPENSVPYVGTWRDISSSTYTDFHAFESHSPEFIGRIVFPITDISGKIVAFNGRHTTGGTPKYYFYPRKAKLPLFPKVQPVEGRVILVEGIFDMLNLYDKGIKNSICSFGAGNVNEGKISMLKIQGVHSIDVFFDGDKAGQEGSEKVKDLCEKVGLNYRNIYIKDTDPGELSKEQVDRLKKQL